MTSKEFIIWMRGFTEGVHEFNITPKQWDLLKEKLAEVSDQSYPFGTITIANPNIASFGTVTTSTATSLPSGSTITYTTSNDKTLLND
jgi:hypothetical protein